MSMSNGEPGNLDSAIPAIGIDLLFQRLDMARNLRGTSEDRRPLSQRKNLLNRETFLAVECQHVICRLGDWLPGNL